MNPYVMLKKVNENDLTIEQFYCGYLIHLSKEKLKDVNKEFGEYFKKQVGNIDFLKAVDTLEEKGFIKNGNVGDVYEFENIIILEPFLELFAVNRDEVWEQVLEVYPMYGFIQGKKIFLQAYDDKLKEFYFTNVLKGGNITQHEKFLSLTDYYFQDKFIDGRAKIKYLRDDQQCMTLRTYLTNWESICRSIILELQDE